MLEAHYNTWRPTRAGARAGFAAEFSGRSYETAQEMCRVSNVDVVCAPGSSYCASTLVLRGTRGDTGHSSALQDGTSALLRRQNSMNAASERPRESGL
jgi:hypothetical protein